MELLDILQARRSIRKYTGEPIPRKMLEKVLQAGLLAPTGRGLCPWEFVVVEDPETLAALSHCRQGSSRMLEQAACAILVWGDTKKTDVWTEDCSLAMGYMHLMAHSLGLGSCWIQGRLRDAESGEETTEAYCRKVLGIPENLALEAILSLGMPAEQPPARSLDTLDTGKVHWEKF